MHPVMQMCNGEPVRRIQARLRRDERPDTEAGIWHARLDGGKKSEQQ